MAQQLLNRQQVLAELADQHGISVTEQTLFRWIRRGIFPAPIKITPRIRGWTPNTPSDWIKSRIASPEAA
jgi:predicted DNA-binding transcriptional regulator AlpA